MFRYWTGFLAALAAASAADAATSPRRIFDDHGGVTAAEVAHAGAHVIHLWESRISYRIPRQSPGKERKLAFLLERANDASLAVSVKFDAARGRVEDRGGLSFPLCVIAVDDLSFEPETPCPPDGPVNVRGEKALGLAYGFQVVGDFESARRLLDSAGAGLDPESRRLLLWLRAATSEGRALRRDASTEEADGLRLAAIADYRALAVLEPDNADHRFAIASLYGELGGYAEAAETLDEILSRWPEEQFRVLIRRGALERSQGRYERALEPLNRIAQEFGSSGGMRYHYHRGWTLSLLRRFDEAVADYTEGLETQPDYASAFHRRGCAYAAIGRLDSALQDLEQATTLLAALPGGARDDVAAAEEDRQRVAEAVAAGRSGPVEGTCGGAYWAQWEKPRSRSPLLPPR